MQRFRLADADARRPSVVFTGLFAEMVKRAGRGLRRALGDGVYLIGFTSLRAERGQRRMGSLSIGIAWAAVMSLTLAALTAGVDRMVGIGIVNDVHLGAANLGREARPVARCARSSRRPVELIR